jgi:hypothetical protein
MQFTCKYHKKKSIFNVMMFYIFYFHRNDGEAAEHIDQP